MSSLSRLVALSARLAGRSYQIAIPKRTAAVLHPPLRYSSVVASATSRSESQRGVSSDDLLRRAFRDLNDQVQRSGRVSHRTIVDAITHGETRGYLDSIELQLLMRAVGGFLRETPASERDTLGDRIWQLRRKTELDISHYNTFLYMKLANSVAFDPTAILKELSDVGVAPNRVTYQRLIQQYGEAGDVQNATKIIDFMKSQNLTISEKVFHSLITGHMRAGNVDAARGVLDVMKSTNSQPNGETYTVLAEELVKSGDIEAALQTIADRTLSDEQVMRVAKEIALRDDLGALAQVIATFESRPFRLNNVLNVVVELIAERKHEAALAAWKQANLYMPNRISSNFIPSVMARCGYSFDDIMRTIDELKSTTSLSETALVDASRAAILSGSRDTAKRFIQKLIESGHVVRPHNFLPLLCSTSNEAELLAELKHMSATGHQLELDLLMDFVLPRLNTTDSEQLLRKLQEAGVVDAHILTALAMLKLTRFNECEKLLAEQTLANERRLAFHLGKATSEENLPTAIRLLEMLVKYSESRAPRPDVVTAFIGGQAQGDTMSAVVIDTLSKSRLPLSSVGFERLKAAGVVGIERLAANVIEFPDRVSSDRLFEEPSTEELEARFEEASKSLTNTDNILRNLIHAYARERNAVKLEQALDKVQLSALGTPTLARVIDAFTQLKKVDRAFAIYDEVMQRDDVLDPYKMFSLTELLVREKRLTEATTVLQHLSPTLKEASKRFDFERHASQLLTAVYDAYGKTTMFEMYDRFLAHVLDARVMGSTVKGLCDDALDEAFELFKDLANRYGGTPYRKLVCKRLIEHKRHDDIETMISILNSALGMIDCCTEMMLCYLEVGLRDDAKSMLARCSGRRVKANLIKACNTYMNDGKLDRLDALLKLVEEVGVEKDVVALYRIKQYNHKNDVQAALDLWTQAQEENVILLPAALDILAKLLERNGQPVPFVVPGVQSFYGDARFTNSPLQDVLERSVDEALEYRAQRKAQGQRLSLADLTALIHELLNNERLHDALDVAKDIGNLSNLDNRQKVVIKRLLGVAASNAMVSELEEFYDASGRTMGRNAIQRAYLTAGRFPEYLEKLESQPLHDVSFYLTPELIADDPAVGARLEKLALRMAKELQDYYGVSQLWYAHVAHGDVDKARALTSQFPDMLTFMQTLRIQPSVKAAFDRAYFSRVLQLTDNKSVLTRVLICTLHELAAKNELDEANKCFDLATENGLKTSNLGMTLLQKIGRVAKDDASPDVHEGSDPQSQPKVAEARSN